MMVCRTVNAVLALAILLGALSAQATDAVFELDIPASDIAEALNLLAEKSEHSLFYLTNDLMGVKSIALKGVYTLPEAIDALLRGTPFSAVVTEKDVIVVSITSTAQKKAAEEQKMRVESKRVSGLAAFLATLLGVGGATTVSAQNPGVAQQQDDAQLEEVVIVGIRSSLRNALQVKENAENIVDVISAEDIGKFPDQNLAESLQRISGVQISRLNGEGRNVTVRGLAPEFTRITFNGRTIATGEITAGQQSSRSFDFKILPSDFVGAVEVYKTPMADLEEGALSATINVRTPRPLDIGKRTFVATASALNEANSGDTTPDVSVLYSDISDNESFGWNLGLTYNERNLESHGFEAFGLQGWVESNTGIDYNMDGDLGDTYRGLHLNQLVANIEDRERTSFMANFQWQPNDDTNLWLDTFYSEFKSERILPGFALRFGNHFGPVTAFSAIPDGTYGSDGIVDYIKMTNVLINPDMRNHQADIGFITAALGGTRTFGEWTVEAELSHSEEEGLYSSLGFVAWAVADVFYDTRTNGFGSLPRDGFSSGAPSAFFITNINGSFRTPSSGKNTDIRIDADKELNWGSDGFEITSVEFGVKFSDRNKKSELNNVDVSGAALERLLGKPIVPDSILPGWGGVNSGPWMTEQRLTGFLSGFDGRASGEFSGMWPDIRLLNSADILAAGGPPRNNPGQAVDVTEKVLAGYIKLNFEGADARLSGNAGVRYVTTDQASFGGITDLASIRYNPATVQTTVDATPGSFERSYDKLLPSFNLRYQVSNNVVARFGAARVMSRPDLTVLSTSTNVNIQTASISAQNPNVDPFLADQLDLSFEWYMDNGGFLAIAPFAKFVDSFIVSANNSMSLNYFNEVAGQNETISVLVSQPDNGIGSDLYGVEINWMQPLDFIFDGFGIIYNTTIVHASEIRFSEGGAVLPLPGLSEVSYNAIAYYENDRFGIRAAYNYRDGFVETSNTNFDNAIEVDAYYQLDLSANYRLTDTISLRLEAININDAVLSKHNGIGVVRSVQDVGRRVTFGIHAKFD